MYRKVSHSSLSSSFSSSLTCSGPPSSTSSSACSSFTFPSPPLSVTKEEREAQIKALLNDEEQEPLPTIPRNKLINTSSIFPTDSEIPMYIRDDVKKMEKEASEKQKAQDILRNKLDLKIHFKNSEKIFPVSKTNTLKQLFDKIWIEYSLFLEPEFDYTETVEVLDVNNSSIGATEKENENSIDENNENSQNNGNNGDEIGGKNVIIDTNNGIMTPENNYYENMRLRFYNITTKTSSDAFDIKSINKTLESINFSSYRYLLLEIKNKNNVFEVYHTDGFSITLEGYNSILNNFCNVRTVRLPKKSTLGDLREIVGPWVEYPEENIR